MDIPTEALKMCTGTRHDAAMTDDETQPYSVSLDDGRIAVRDAPERVVVVCRDEANAANYAALLNEAYQRGYRAGYRDGWEASRNNGGK
jgi:hypothetical protein